MVLPKNLEYVYIIVNIFVNTQSILKILVSKRNGFNGLCLCKNIHNRCFVNTLYVL